MTIEEKLSAIKAINEEKELVDDAIQKLASSTEVYRVDLIGLTKVQIPRPVGEEVKQLLSGYFKTRHSELIEKAKSLMQ